MTALLLRDDQLTNQCDADIDFFVIGKGLRNTMRLARNPANGDFILPETSWYTADVCHRVDHVPSLHKLENICIREASALGLAPPVSYCDSPALCELMQGVHSEHCASTTVLVF